MRLWVDFGVDDLDRPWLETLFGVISAHPLVELVGVSFWGDDALGASNPVGVLLASVGIADVLIYASTPDPRALDAAEGLLAVGPATSLARLARHDIELPPMVLAESTFGLDPMAAAILVNTARDVLVIPRSVEAACGVDGPLFALFALLGEHIVIGKRQVGVGLDGVLIVADDQSLDNASDDLDGGLDGLVERDVVVDCDQRTLARRVASLSMP